MGRPRPYPTRGDVMGILFIVVLLGLISLGFSWFTNSKPNNYGFGPDWDCTLVPNGQPICVKKLGQ
jgi:hypothetical protein